MLTSPPTTDVFIVGGGPAGLAAAIAVRQKGLQVIVADGATPPIEKPCGEGMMPETLIALRDLGVQFNSSEGHVFRGINFIQEGVQVSAAFPQNTGIGLRRTVLHERLVARAEASGVQFLWKTPVTGLDADGVQLLDRKVRARWIVGADGQGSRVRRWAGLGTANCSKMRHASRRHYRVKPWSECMEIYWGDHAQAYVTPLSTSEMCIVIVSHDAQQSSFDAALHNLPQLQARLAGAELTTRERGSVTLMRTLRHVQRGHVALVGDASGGVDAITGEGLRLAFRQALALADAFVLSDLTEYEQAHRELAKRPMLLSTLMLFLGRHPRIRRRVIRAMHHNPDLLARLVATHAGYGTSADLLSTGALLGWQLLAV